MKKLRILSDYGDNDFIGLYGQIDCLSEIITAHKKNKDQDISKLNHKLSCLQGELNRTKQVLNQLMEYLSLEQVTKDPTLPKIVKKTKKND